MSKTILIVDDSATMIMSLKAALEMQGFTVESASNGQSALDKIKSGLKPNLIITDINMPVMDGLEFIKNVRPILRFVPILILTTESEQKKREEAKKLGATGWLVKPVSGGDLINVIKKVLPGA
ncbi:MAG: response regulator [Thermodesulfovibrio sp.]|uniref:response regulator n=1 Tax=unclassified Thermodesulfovibrio TaxID=2645936 RepID=UPI00083AB07A|nr:MULTISPECIES: response regulator [unclassified Thermodesulfovibrio]MDI1472372.1 response regulator [Thermodesulfovibrio sp. 1176]MDI6714237.1 response regulator [Thermodesulfovibrio sp.]ODA43949.1 Chemotaxis regulator - transmits chemoreceptor signals to flagelllar motor components CheY [Thermodesulfovibrio sp. N1]